MIYGSTQNILAIGITGRKTKVQVNQIAHFYQGDLVKEKMNSPLKVSDVINNAGVRTIGIVILFFMELSQWSKINALCSSGFITIITKYTHYKCYKEEVLCPLKRIKTYLRSTTSQQRLNHLMVLHIHVSFAKDMGLKQVTNNMISKKSEKKEYSGEFVQSSNWILCIYKYVCVDKMQC